MKIGTYVRLTSSAIETLELEHAMQLEVFRVCVVANTRNVVSGVQSQYVSVESLGGERIQFFDDPTYGTLLRSDAFEVTRKPSKVGSLT